MNNSSEYTDALTLLVSTGRGLLEKIDSQEPDNEKKFTFVNNATDIDFRIRRDLYFLDSQLDGVRKERNLTSEIITAIETSEGRNSPNAPLQYQSFRMIFPLSPEFMQFQQERGAPVTSYFYIAYNLYNVSREDFENVIKRFGMQPIDWTKESENVISSGLQPFKIGSGSTMSEESQESLSEEGNVSDFYY